jgi:hypothetical protein
VTSLLVHTLSRVLLGEDAQLLSFTANTVAPGQPGQTPHLDYPYYHSFFPKAMKSHYFLKSS